MFRHNELRNLFFPIIRASDTIEMPKMLDYLTISKLPKGRDPLFAVEAAWSCCSLSPKKRDLAVRLLFRSFQWTGFSSDAKWLLLRNYWSGDNRSEGKAYEHHGFLIYVDVLASFKCSTSIRIRHFQLVTRPIHQFTLLSKFETWLWL